MSKLIGVLTAGGDTPGLNAALRGIGKAAIDFYGMEVLGFRDGFRGLMENRAIRLGNENLSGILTIGGTILGTSRDKPHRMPVGGKTLDMTDVIAENYHSNHLEALVCLGGGGTQKNALKLAQKGLNIITLPKTIDNDVALTETTFGFDTALSIATEAIDRLHSTAHSHHRIIVVELMGHRVGWLALGAGLAGGADVILIPEIPYDVEKISEAILSRSRRGKHFSIVAVAEGIIPAEQNSEGDKSQTKKSDQKKKQDTQSTGESKAPALARELEKLTGLESRLTILGHLQRGGTPSALDRILATRMGTAAAELIKSGVFGVMTAVRGENINPVSLEDVAGKVKYVPPDHAWIRSGRRLGVSFGD